MERLALIVVLSVTSTGAACQTPQSRISSAVSVQAVVRNPPKPELPASCTVLMEIAKPKLTEAWVVTQKRWEFLAENRDQAAEDCRSEWDAYWSAYKAALNTALQEG
ncbi:MAG: hypothetical protein KL839_04835 [Rhizobium sp.]|nr:hypothetical protein [Rhizobium sp.]